MIQEQQQKSATERNNYYRSNKYIIIINIQDNDSPLALPFKGTNHITA